MNPADRAASLLFAHPLVDGHNDLPYALRELAGGPVTPDDLDKFELHRRQARTRTDLPRLTEGQIGAQFWSVYVPGHLSEPEAVAQTLEQIDLVHLLIRRHPDRLALATTAAGVERAFLAGQVASLLGAEGGHCIAGSLGVLRMFRRLGVRYLTLTHNSNVAWADSATDVHRLGGLDETGRAVVREMNRIGMLVDLSHVAVTTMRDALATSRVPVLFSHSSARAVCDHVRNVPDEVLRTLAGNGGVCMVTFVPAFVCDRRRLWEAERDAELLRSGDDAAAVLRRIGGPPPVTLSQVADHVEHVRATAGVEHVGLGGDFDGCDDMPSGLDDVAGYPALFAELVSRGWSDADLALLAGGNVLRVLRAAEEAEER